VQTRYTAYLANTARKTHLTQVTHDEDHIRAIQRSIHTGLEKALVGDSVSGKHPQVKHILVALQQRTGWFTNGLSADITYMAHIDKWHQHTSNDSLIRSYDIEERLHAITLVVTKSSPQGMHVN